jgi:arsenite/tail-anchored protein-transporting ATPase
VLGAKLSGEPTQIEENLFRVEIDAVADAAAYMNRLQEDVRGSVSLEVLPAVHRHLDLAKSSPSTEESALFNRFADLIVLSPGEYDCIVSDIAPTGHTLRLLRLPAPLTAWMEGMVRQREKVVGMERMLRNLAGKEDSDEDPVLNRLRERRERFHHARHRLLKDANFYLVLILERLPIEETARTLHSLTENGLAIGGLVVNRVLPNVAEGDFMRARLEQQSDYLEEIKTRFWDQSIIHIEQNARDINRREQLKLITARLEAAGLA